MGLLGGIQFAAFLLLLKCGGGDGDRNHVCDSQIYCYGRLLHEVQMKSVYADCKTYVDMRMKTGPEEVLAAFEELLNVSHNHLNRNKLENFVRDNFDRVSSEFETWTPTDWVPDPRFVNKVYDSHMKEFALKLNHMWKYLGRKIAQHVNQFPERYSIIYVPHPMIVPGGRFREFYYWDSYWIIRGLLVCEMYQTVKGMLLNYLHLVKHHGLIPNGGRVYYTGRSQPPMLIPMVKAYIEFSEDRIFLEENLSMLEEEFSFWITNRTVKVSRGGVHTLARFDDETSGPRPESYREDIESASVFTRDEDKDDFYREMKAAAESGRDFTSRWFVRDGTNKGKLIDTKTRHIIPVDLNAMMEWNARLLSEFCSELGMQNKAAYYAKMAKNWMNAIQNVLWHEDVGSWLDWDLLNDKRRHYFYPSNLAPLWTNSFPPNMAEHLGKRVMEYLEENGIPSYPGGVPSSAETTGEQWDFPNTWSPLQDMIITGLHNTGEAKALAFSRELTHKWVFTNYRAFQTTKAMYEKYDATSAGAPGGGGEYDIQMGFGWTNGLVLDLLERYGDQMILTDEKGSQSRLVWQLRPRFELVLSGVVLALLARRLP